MEPFPHPRITLLTDFGTADGYVAALCGVLATLAPAVPVDHASHDVPPGDIAAAASALSRYWEFYPAGTVHVIVVDPGVGSARRALLVRAAGRMGVGPDNGVFEPMLAHADDVREITCSALFRQPVSATFHGRDIFAPVAAWLALGGLPERVGAPLPDPVRADTAVIEASAGTLLATVVHVDRFGNLITNLSGARIGRGTRIEIDGRSLGEVRRTYAEADSGEALALIGSSGFLEIAVRDGSAAQQFGATRGTRVRVTAAP